MTLSILIVKLFLDKSARHTTFIVELDLYEASPRKDLDFVYNLFPKLLERKSQLAQTLSGGEQQMLAIAR